MSDANWTRLLESLFSLDDELLVDQAGSRFTAISYRQARSLIAWLGRAVDALDARPSAIGILSNHRAEAYLTVLYAFISGIRFVPLNPSLPRKRLQRIVELAGVDLVVFDETHLELAAQLGRHSLDFSAIIATHQADPISAGLTDFTARPEVDACAYHMFTSGSTGEPKGVPISRDNLAAYVTGVTEFIPFPTRARFSQFFDLSFDLSMHDIFVALHLGGTIVPPSTLDLMMPSNYVERNKIDVWFSVPILAQVASQGYRPDKHRHKLSLALFCGEALPARYIENFRALLQPESAIYNLYGPTEATIAFTGHKIGRQDNVYPIVPIGNPFAHNRVRLYSNGEIIDTFEEGQEGELLLGGPQVFGGYRPAQAPQAFVLESGLSWYRSGDLVRYRNGVLHHLGRLDDQFKIRGNRVEYGEIEAAYRQAFGLEFVVAFLHGEYENKKICLAYVGDRVIENFDAELVALPDYMQPKKLYRVKRIPTNINGKVDREELCAMADQAE
jgi:amino acid adenylation domain-containing protein